MAGEFNQPTFADLRLVLRSSQGATYISSELASDGPPSKRQCSRLSLDHAGSFYTHKVILASKSPVIKAMLLRAKELRDIQAECSRSVGQPKKGQRKRSAGGRSGSLPSTHQLPDLQLETLELPVEQEELLACEVLFRSIYSDNLAEEVRSALSSEQGAGVNRTTLLMQVYRLADRLEVCTDQCACAISSLSSADFESVHAVNYAFSWRRAAPALVEHATIKAVLEECLSHLVARFGVIRRVIRSSSSLAEFKCLDFLTVLAFFDSDKLEVVSENEVILLMGMWMGKDRADCISEEQLGAFWSVLRLGHLTTSLIANLDAVAPWLPVDPVVLARVAAWKGYQTIFPGKAASIPKGLQSVYGSSVAWFRDKRQHQTHGSLYTCCISEGDLAKLLTAVEHAGAQEVLLTVRACRLPSFNGYDIFPTLSVQIVPADSRKTFVLSVGFEFRTSAAYMSASIQPLPLAHVKADFLLGKGTVFKGSVDELLYGTHSWEVARVGTLDDFSCLDSYLDEEGELSMRLTFRTID